MRNALTGRGLYCLMNSDLNVEPCSTHMRPEIFRHLPRTFARYYIYGYLMPALIIIATNTVALVVNQYAYVRDEL